MSREDQRDQNETREHDETSSFLTADGEIREKARCESEERYQSLFESIDEGFCIIEVLFDDDGKACDYRFLEVNPAFEEQTGLANVTGKTMRDIVPNHEEHWFEKYGKVALTGEPMGFEDSAAELGRFFDVYAFRVGDPEERRVALLFNDITERKRLEVHDQFLLKLNDALRPLTDSVAIQGEACRILAEWIDVDRSYYVEVDEAAGVARVERDFVRGDVPSLAGEHPVADFGWAVEVLRSGEHYAISDTQSSKLVPQTERPTSAALRIIACIGVPLIKEDRLVGAFCVTNNRERKWTEGEVELVREVGERIWAAIERARAEKALRESEDRYRRLFESMDKAYAVVEVLEDENGEWSDFRFLEVNSAFMEHTGMPYPVGKTATEILGTPNPRWAVVYGQVAKTGEPVRFIDQEEELDKIFELYVFRLGGEESRRVAVLFTDITERKRQEQNHIFLDEVKDGFARLSTPELAMQMVGEKLGDYMNISHAIVSEMDESNEKGLIQHLWPKKEAPELPETIDMAAFVEDDFYDIVRKGKALVVQNIGTHPVVKEEAYDDINVRSLVKIPYFKNGEWKYLLTIFNEEPREWRVDEVELLENLVNHVFPRLERYRAEVRLKENEERLKLSVETGGLGTWELDLTNNSFAASDICKNNFGLSPDEELSYSRLQDIIHPEDFKQWEKAIKQAAEEKSFFNIEYRVQRPDNKIDWIFAKGSPVSIGADGNPDKLVGVTQNITQRKRRENMEHEQSRLLECIANDLPLKECLSALCESVPKLSPGVRASILITDEERKSFQPPVAPDMLPSWSEGLDGVPVNEMMIGTCGEAVFSGKSISCKNVKEDGRWSKEWREMCLANGVLAGYSEPINTSDGVTRGSFMLCFNAPREPDEWERQLLNFGTHVASIALERHRSKQALREYNERLEERVHERTLRLKNNQQKLRALITKLNQAEEQERKYIAGELHDNLGQLLAVAKMKLDFMETGGNGKEVAEASDMINDAITYTRELMSSLKPPEALGDEDFKTAVKWVADKMKKYDLSVHIEDDGRPKSLGEETRSTVLRSIRELLFNVVKHANVNKATVKLSRTNGAVEIAVEDEGDGFEADKQKSKTSLDEGFGLYNVYERIERFNGGFSVTSEPGDGTKAVLSVPLKAEQSEEHSAIGEGKQLVSALRESDGSEIITVMLVDDHDITREGLNKIITDAKDFKLAGEAKNGLEAVEKARELMPQVIVMDVNMPELNGIEATKRIKAEWPDIEIIGLSFRNDDDVAGQMRNAGASAFVTKSNATDELCTAIREKVNS